MTRRTSIISVAAAIMAMASAVRPSGDDGGYASLTLGSYSNRNHGWDGKRKKLKRYKLDHNRPHRGRARR